MSRKRDEEEWTEIKRSDEVYPKNSISLLMLSTGMGWVDKAYEKYPFRANCPWHLLISVDLSDNPGLDVGKVEKFFAEELRKVGIAHTVARLGTANGLELEMYVENNEESINHLQAILNNPDRLVSFTYVIEEDPNWEEVKDLMGM